MRNRILGMGVACLLAATSLRLAQGAWRGDVIYCGNAGALSAFGARLSVAEFDFTRPVVGRNGQHLDDPPDKVEYLYHARDMSGDADALFNIRAVVMYDPDSALVLCARPWRDDSPLVWLVQVEYHPEEPYKGDKGAMNAGASRGADAMAGGLLTGRLQLPVAPEKGWSPHSPARRDLPEIGAAGMVGSDGVMDMAKDSAGNLYICGRNSRTDEGLVFRVPAKGPHAALGPGKGQRIGEGRFGSPVKLICKASGKSWFTSVAIDAGGLIYLTDRTAGTLDVYSPDGQAILSYNTAKELNLAPEAVRIDPLYHAAGVQLVLNVQDTRTPASPMPTKLAVLNVNAATKEVRVVKLLFDGNLREGGDMGMNAVDALEISPEGDIIHIDSRGENDARIALISAEDYLKAIAAPKGPACRVEVIGADVLVADPGAMRQFGRGAAFVPKVRSPQSRPVIADADGLQRQLDQAQAQLARQLAAQPVGTLQPSSADALLNTYASIADAKQALAVPADEVRAVCYEAITRAPDAPGIEDMIARLAGTFEPPARTNLLRNLTRRHATQQAGQAASRLLVRDMTASATVPSRLQDLAIQVPVPCVVQEVTRALTKFFPATSATEQRDCAYRAFDLVWRDHSAEHDPVLAAMFLECGRPLLQLKSYPVIEGLCQSVRATGASEPFQKRARQLLCQARLADGDPIGALAAVSPVRGDSERGALLAELCRLKDYAAVADSLNKSVDEAIEAARAFDANIADRDGLFRQVAEAAEGLGFWRVATVGWREVVRLHKGTVRSAADGMDLGVDFPPGSQFAAQAAGLWKAHALLATGQAEAAATQLRLLAKVECPSLQGQALYDLARLRVQQGWIEDAQACAACCAQHLPGARPVQDLQSQIAERVQQQEKMQQTYQRWAQLRKAADESAQSDVAVESLLSLADVEMQLASPRRAAGVLEEALQRHGQSKHTSQVLGRLVAIYRNELHDAARADAYQQRLSGGAVGDAR